MQMDLDDMDFDDAQLNAAFENLEGGEGGEFGLLDSQLDDAEFSADDMALSSPLSFPSDVGCEAYHWS